MIRYELPKQWIKYDKAAVAGELAEAKAALLSLRTVPYQREWVDRLQEIELKREVAGTSRIEGADFTDRELDVALRAATPEELATRSQKQALAAKNTYRWIAQLPPDRPITSDVISEIHRRIVIGADDDHCQPGKLRGPDENVNFGQPRHRGVDGGDECAVAFKLFAEAVQRRYSEHDPTIQALAAHYHLAAMHPFLDGNGRTARALEALLLQRAGLRDTCFVAMSNYYYDEKVEYLTSLAAVRAQDHDLTPFLKFALRGVALQSRRLLQEIQLHLQKALFRNLMYDLFNRLKTPRKRVIAERQMEILKLLLDNDVLTVSEIARRTSRRYEKLSKPFDALLRDLTGLLALRAVELDRQPDAPSRIRLRLVWPTEITETAFFKTLQDLPKARTHPFLQ